MNEKIPNQNEMVRFTDDTKIILETILKNTLKTRPQNSIYYMPWKKQIGVRAREPLSEIVVDFNEIYPDAEDGDFAYFEFNIIPMEDLEVFINVKGNVEIDFNQKRLIEISDGTATPQVGYSFDSFNVPISVKKEGENRVRVKCTKTDKVFGMSFLLSIKRYPSMWANDYLYWMRAVIPDGHMKGEEGILISCLYKKGSLVSQPSFIEPESKKRFDFEELSEYGDKAYVYTVCRVDSRLDFSGTVKNIYVNGESVGNKDIFVEDGDTVLIECEKEDNSWYFEFQDSNFHLPFLKSGREYGVKAICLTGFSAKDKWKNEYLDFKTLHTVSGRKHFWQFSDGSHLRIYLDSVFYGQWFYALMVGFFGIREVSGVLKNSSAFELFWNNMKFMADYFDYIQYDAENFGMPAFMPRCVGIDNLDDSGTMGMNFIDAYFIRPDESIAKIIEYLADILEKKIPRFPDGTYYRKSTMWADDTYMSIPFLVRLYKYTNDKKWLVEARNQLVGYKEKLYMKNKRLFSHIYFVEDSKCNLVPWGRGNGWIMIALSEFLMYCDDRKLSDEILEIYREFAEGVRACQTESGMWRQVLDRDDDGSYLETSATAMFMLSLARGVNNKWIDESYVECVNKAWNGLLTYSVDKNGNIYGVSMGSGCSREAEYYFDIQTCINDDHGTGIILAAACELLKMRQEAVQYQE